MYLRTVLSVLVAILNLGTAIKACPNIQGCSFDNSDCTSLTCQKTILGKTVYLTIKLDACKTDLSATITVEERSFGISFTHTFKAQGNIPIPGLSFGVASANIRVKIYRQGSDIILEESQTTSFTTPTTDTDGRCTQEWPPMPGTGSAIKEGRKRPESLCCAIDSAGWSSWFSKQSTAIKALIIGSAVVVVLGIIGCFICCCCCKRDENRVAAVAPQPAGQVIMQTMPQTLPQVA